MPHNIVTILTHNAGWFQGWPYVPETPKEPVPAVVEALTQRYTRFDPDVVCLQEIQSGTGFDVVRRALGMRGAFCPGIERSVYGGGLFWHRGKADGDARTEKCVVQRFWQAARLHLGEGANLRICNLHLSSSRHIPETEAAETRVSDLRQMLRCRRPHIIAGDFNEGPTGGPSTLLAGEGYVDTALLVDDAPMSTGVNKARSDQIWIAQEMREAFIDFGFVDWPDLTLKAPGKDTLSDHLPLWIRLDGRVARSVALRDAADS